MNNITLDEKHVKLSYRRLDARDILVGKISLKSRYNMGLHTPISVDECMILDEDILVSFHPYDDTLHFKKNDRISLDLLTELIRNKCDSLSSNGVCVKPIYARPQGYISENHNTYTYKLTDILDNKASLPYHLYTTNKSGVLLGEAMLVLAHNINIHITDDKYLTFKPGSITVNEIMSICNETYNEYKDVINNTYWGVSRTLEMGGILQRGVNYVTFRLVDLIQKRSYLPLSKIDGQ